MKNDPKKETTYSNIKGSFTSIEEEEFDQFFSIKFDHNENSKTCNIKHAIIEHTLSCVCKFNAQVEQVEVVSDTIKINEKIIYSVPGDLIADCFFSQTASYDFTEAEAKVYHVIFTTQSEQGEINQGMMEAEYEEFGTYPSYTDFTKVKEYDLDFSKGTDIILD